MTWFTLYKDDVTLAIIQATAKVMEATLKANLDNFTKPTQVLNLATGSTACAAEYILELDGFNAPMVVDLLTKRFHNFVQQYPTRGAAAELHNCDFMDMIYRGFNAIADDLKFLLLKKACMVELVQIGDATLKRFLMLHMRLRLWQIILKAVENLVILM